MELGFGIYHLAYGVHFSFPVFILGSGVIYALFAQALFACICFLSLPCQSVGHDMTEKRAKKEVLPFIPSHGVFGLRVQRGRGVLRAKENQSGKK